MSLFGKGLKKPNRFSYRPRYYDPEKEEREIKKAGGRLRLEKGAFFKNKKSHIAGAFTGEKYIAMRDKRNRRSQSLRLMLLVAMLSFPMAYFLEMINGFIAFVATLIILIFYITQINKI